MLVLAFYPSSRATARPPETSQSQAEHTAAVPSSCRSSSANPPQNRTRSTRAIRRSRRYTAFSTAPAGSTPCVAYRQSAINNFRASATMPTLRVRLPRLKRA